MFKQLLFINKYNDNIDIGNNYYGVIITDGRIKQ